MDLRRENHGADLSDNRFGGRDIEGYGQLRPMPGQLEGYLDDTTAFDLLSHVLKRWWVVALFVMGSVVISVIYMMSQTPVYRSEAILEVVQPEEDALKKIGAGAQPTPMLNPSEAYATQTELLQSRWLAEALVKKMDLSQTQEFGREPANLFHFFGNLAPDLAGKGPEAANKPGEDALIKEIMSRVSASRRTDTRLISLSFTASDPLLARQLLNEHINIYLERNLSERRRYAVEALNWLNSELARVEAKLVKSLAELVEFNKKHGLVSLDEENNHVLNFFNRAAEELVEARAQRAQLEAHSRGADYGGPIEAVDETRIQEIKALKQRLASQESQYAELSQVYSEDYPRLALLRKQIETQKRLLEDIQKAAVGEALQGAREKEVISRRAFEKAKQEAMSLNSHGVQRAVLQKEVETNDEIYKILLEKSKTMALNSQIIGNDIRVVDTPTLPLTPISPKKGLIIGVGLFFGLLLGVCAAIGMESLDNKIRYSEDVEDKVGLEALGLVLDGAKAHNADTVRVSPYEFTAVRSPRAPVTESIRSVKNRIFLPTSAASIRSLMVTSPGPSEGKTFVAVSLAMILALEDEKRVLLIDADLRKPRIGNIFGHNSDAPGLSSILTLRDVNLNKMIKRCRESGLYYLPSGPVPSNPAGLLGSQKMAHFLKRAREQFDLIIVDCPPTLGFSDAHIAASLTDGAVLLAKQGEVPYPALIEAKEELMAAKGRILGVIITLADSLGARYGKYKYYDKYYRSLEENRML